MDIRRKKLLFQSQHRGTKELDIFLGNYAKKWIQHMSETDLLVFESILNEKDLDLSNWIFKKCAPPKHQNNNVMHSLISYCNDLIAR